MAVQAGKRLRVFFSDNNAGIDDALLGGVVPSNLGTAMCSATSGRRTAGTSSG